MEIAPVKTEGRHKSLGPKGQCVVHHKVEKLRLNVDRSMVSHAAFIPPCNQVSNSHVQCVVYVNTVSGQLVQCLNCISTVY